MRCVRLPLHPLLLDAPSALETGFDASQFLPVTSGRLIGGGKQRSQLCLSQQVTLDLQDEPLELRAIGLRHGVNVPCADFVRAILKWHRVALRKNAGSPGPAGRVRGRGTLIVSEPAAARCPLRAGAVL